MGGPFAYNSLIPHKCRSRTTHSSPDHYCSFCGIFISPDPGTMYLRPASFSNFNAFIGDQSQMVGHMVRKQTIHYFYNQEAFHLPVRLNLVDWLEKTAKKYNLNASTVHLAVAIIDVVLSDYAISVDSMEIMIFTALNIAGKMEDRDERLPHLDDVPHIFQKPITLSDLETCERIVFRVLNFNANIQTPLRFANYFASVGAISNQELNGRCATALISEFERLMSLFTSASLRRYEFCQFEAVKVGAAIIAAARKALGLTEPWTKHLERISNVSRYDLQDCLKILDNVAAEIYSSELVVQNLFPTPRKRKSIQSVIETTDKKLIGAGNDVDEKQIFVSQFSFNSSTDEDGPRKHALKKKKSKR